MNEAKLKRAERQLFVLLLGTCECMKMTLRKDERLYSAVQRSLGVYNHRRYI